MRLGRFADVVSSNEQAVKADEDYIAQCKAQGLYPLGYYPHNIHFIWMGASAAGRSRLALESARKVASVIPADALKDVPVLQGFVVVPYWAMVRFAQWSDILADKGPTYQSPFTNGAWKFARGMALSATGRLDEAEKELAELKDDRGRSCARSARDVVGEQRTRDPAHRARSAGGRDRGEEEGLGHGHPASRSRRPLRGCAGLQRAARLAGARSPDARGRAARGGPAG